MFKIFGHSQCGYCTKAKQELSDRDIEYTYYDIREDEKAFEAFSFYNFQTVPVIVDNGALVGGFDKLVNYLESKGIGDFNIEL